MVFLPTENYSAAARGPEGRLHSQGFVYKVTVKFQSTSSYTYHLQSHLPQSVSVFKEATVQKYYDLAPLCGEATPVILPCSL